MRRSLPALGLMLLLGAGSSASPCPQAGRPGQSPRDRTALPLRGGGLAPGRVLSEARITAGAGLPDTLDPFDRFGREVTDIGDLDGDGTADLAVSASSAFWILFLAPDGSVRSFREHRLRELFGSGFFVGALAALGDLDGDGRPELALGDLLDDEAGSSAGAVRILSLEPDGSFELRQKITAGRGGFPAGLIDAEDVFGCSLAVLDDLDGDGVVELAVGASGDEQGCLHCNGAGSLWILFLNPDGTVHEQGRIGRGAVGHSLPLDSGDSFGSAVAVLGDLDGDGVDELAVGAELDDDTFFFAGAVYVVYLGALGTARASQKINEVAGGFVGDGTIWGSVGADSVAGPGDIDGDGVPDLLVGSGDLAQSGGYWVLALHPDGTVKTQSSVHEGAGGFTGDPIAFDRPGDGLALLGDLDGNGVRDLALGAPGDHGALWLLRLGAGAQVLSERHIATGEGGLPPDTLDPLDHLGASLAPLGDLDGDGRAEVAVGAPEDDDGASAAGRDRGAVWVLSLADDGALDGYTKINASEGGFTGSLIPDDRFGSALAFLGDLDGDGTRELAVGAPRDDDGVGRNRGAVWILSLAPDASVVRHAKISTAGGFPALLDEEGLGSALAPLGDLDGDGVADLAAASPGLNQSSGNGRVWILFLRADGSLREAREIGEGTGGFGGALDVGDNFGSSLAFLGDLDGDGRPELAVGAARDDDGGLNRGAAWLLSLAPDGSVLGQRKLSATSGGFAGALDDEDMLGGACAALGDLDGDGVLDLAVAAPGDDDRPVGASDINRGAVWVLFLRTDGSVRAHAKISATAGGFTGPLAALDRFGSALSGELDLDGDGVRDLLVGVPNEDGLARPLEGADKGGLWLLSLAGIATLDFEHGDDVARTPLENGRSLTGPGAFARTLELTGFGANLGPALFDSAPSGPNDPSQDRDLLVGRGNLLVLQNSQAPTQSVPGIFDRPNDDQDGGLFVFRFPAAVAPLSLVLVDIDLGAGQHASVRLFDVAGRTRTFAIPAGWTEDLLVHGPPAWRTLELTTLDPQPGYLASATASESPSFRADEVVRIEVTLGSSGAVDELRFDPHPSGE